MSKELEVGKVYYGMNMDWLELIKIEIIKKTPQRYYYKVLSKYHTYETYKDIDVMENRFFETLEEAKEFVMSEKIRRKERIVEKFNKDIGYIERRFNELLEREDNDF